MPACLRLVFLLFLFGCLGVRTDAAPTTATDSQGRRVSLARPPRRIVSLIPSGTEMLFALGLGDHVVADSANCDYPPQARKLPHVGDFFVSAERVMAQRPDLVIASHEADPRGVDHLTSLLRGRAAVFCVDPRNFGELYATLRALGDVAGVRPAADRLIARLQKRADALRTRLVRKADRPRVACVVQVQPVWLAGRGTFLDEMIELAGGANIGRAAGTGYQTLSLERLIVAAPQVLLLDRPSPVALANQPGWSRTPAVRRGAVYVLGLEAFRPGPRLIDATEQLARRLHPELFQSNRKGG